MKPILSLVAVLALGLLGVMGYLLVRHEMRHSLGAPKATANTQVVTLLPTQFSPTTSSPATEPPPQSGFGWDSPPAANSKTPVLKDAYLLVMQNKMDDALALLTTSIQATPNDPALYNARAFVHVQQQHLDLAKQDLLKCIELGGSTSMTKFDLAEIDFLLKDYDAARQGFLALKDDRDRGDLSAFKAFLCLLLAGHEDDASKELDLFNLKGMHASYYFANIAWDVYHHKTEDARTWLDSANRIFSPQKLDLYSSSLKSLGYLPLPEP